MTPPTPIRPAPGPVAAARAGAPTARRTTVVAMLLACVSVTVIAMAITTAGAFGFAFAAPDTSDIAATSASAASDVSDASDPSDAAAAAERWVTAYNRRDFGQPGWRRVTIALRQDDVETRRFSVAHAWQVREPAVDALFLLEAPAAMAGTAYLQVEDATAPGLDVHLFLPAGRRRVLAVAPEEQDEGLLGSDFSYDDLRMRLPRAGRTYRSLGAATLGGESIVRLDVTRAGGAWRRARLSLTTAPLFLVAADYFRQPGDRVPFKQFRVTHSTWIGGVRSAQQMVMTGEGGRSTVMTLIDSRFKVPPFDAALFTIEHLPRTGQALARLFTDSREPVPARSRD